MRTLLLFLAIALLTPVAHAETAATPPLRVMSFNIRYGTADDGPHSWPQRAPHVAGTIVRFAPDLLGTQECLAFQRDELQAALPGYAVVAVGRDDGAEAGEMCACFYRHERFALRDHGTFWLSDTPDAAGSRGWDAALPRIATWLRLDDRGTGAEILWLNTHFDHLGEVARRESAALLHRWLAANGGEAVVVVTGDFNAPAGAVDGSVHRTLLFGDDDTPLLCDAWTRIHGPDEDPTITSTFHGFRDTPSRGRIDWVLCSCETTVLEAAIDRSRAGEVWPSDHFPVTAVLELRR